MSFSPTLNDVIDEESMTSDNLPSQSEIEKGYDPTSSDISNQTVDTFLGRLPSSQDVIESVGSFNPKEAQKGADILAAFLAPEFKAAKYLPNVLKEIPGVSGLINSLGRIGYGTALTSAPLLRTKEGREKLPTELPRHLQLNALLEGLSYPLGRAWDATAELFNPIKYARNKAFQIKAEHDAAKATMDANYKPINDKYGDTLVSVKPKEYLKKRAGIKKNALLEDAKDLYDDFLEEPTYKNLLALKSQIGRDWAKVSSTDDITKTQLFNKYQRNLDKRLRSFLGTRDKNALSQYELANKYAENVYYPYLSTPTLRTISKGKLQGIYPDKMSKSLEKATTRTVGAERKYTIPQSHPLREHANQLRNRLKVGDIAEIGLPTLSGFLLGGHAHPGGLGSLTGLGTGLGLGLGGSKLLEYPIVQSPLVQNIFKKLEPFYYKGGRAAIMGKDEAQ